MITKLCKVAVTLLGLATAKDLFEEDIKAAIPLVGTEVVEEVVEEDTSWTDIEWVGFGLGALLGVLIELGTNTEEMWPCLGQPAIIGESAYFTYFYIR